MTPDFLQSRSRIPLLAVPLASLIRSGYMQVFLLRFVFSNVDDADGGIAEGSELEGFADVAAR